MRKKSYIGYCYPKSTMRWQEWYGDKKMKTLHFPHITNKPPVNDFHKNMKTRFKKVRVTIEAVK